MNEIQGAYSGGTKQDTSQEIVIELNILNNSIERLGKTIEELTNKVQSILSQPTPGGSDDNTKVKEITAPLAMQIRVYKEKIDIGRDVLADLINRVEL